MAIIHHTTMTPSKLELLTGWLPAQPWYLGAGRKPELARAGGFRLDDPAGEVGIEFMVVTDQAAGQAASYLVPMTYRAHELTGADGGLIGMSRHGVLGDRWIYDGARDPVLVTELIALVQGTAEPQAQTVSDTPDLTVTSRPVASHAIAITLPAATTSGPSGTQLRIPTTSADGIQGTLLVHLHRTLQPDSAPDGAASTPGVSATWRQPDGTPARGSFATAHYAEDALS